jgi:RHS repeat-associated protein
MYDGEGHRVEQYISGGSGSHTYYLPGNVEELTPSNTLVKYYTAGGLSIGENTTVDATGISYLASDGLGSVSDALNQTGTATGSILYSPYGSVRYSSGTMPTAKGLTGQYADASTGLDYYRARYYDPSIGQFSTAEPAGDGLNLYMYVHGNPETLTDPTGLVTGGVCVRGTAGIPGVGVFGEICFVVGWDPNAGWSGGMTLTGGGPANTGVEVGAALNAGLQFSNAATVDDLGGPFTYGGVGGSIDGVGGYGTGFGGRGTHGQGVGGFEGGWQAGENFEIYADESGTQVIDFNQIKHLPVIASRAARQAVGWAGQQLSNAGAQAD